MERTKSSKKKGMSVSKSTKETSSKPAKQSKRKQILVKPKKSKKQQDSQDLVDLTANIDTIDVTNSGAVVKDEALDVCSSDDGKFVIDKVKGTIVEPPLYRNPKPRSLAEVLNGLRCHGNLVPPGEENNMSRLTKTAATNLEKRQRKVARRRLRALKGKSEPRDDGEKTCESPSLWDKVDAGKVKRANTLQPPSAEAISALPLSYNPDPASVGLRGVVKEAAGVLTAYDRAVSKVERQAELFRKAKPLSFAEQLAEMSVGLFDEGSGKKKKNEVESGDEEIKDNGLFSKPATNVKLTKRERKRSSKEKRTQLLAQKRREKNRMDHELLYRLKAIRKEVAVLAARRSALQTHEAQRASALRRRLSMWHRRVLRQATIRAVRQREAAALIQRAPPEIIGDDHQPAESTANLRLISPRTKTLALEHFVSAQRRGLLLDYRAMESSRQIINKRKARGYKKYTIDQ